MLTEADLPALDGIDALFFGGISLVVEPCAAAYEALCLAAAETRPVMLDPNIRPGFITDEAAYRARLDRMIAAAAIVKLSDEDLRWLLGDGEIDALAATLLARGPHLVCVTRGAEGVTGYTARGAVTVASEQVTVVDTVGAGDTFNAGLLAQLAADGVLTREGIADLSDDTLRAALSLGARAAAVTVSRAGANPPWAREL